ncbi:acyl carrier protein [Xanthobacter sp. V4C-4]|uniref:acyl carrier protein n=1 Tax=Xanthobacter cornucopiae TaxID=3119924 RepID=UPI00372AA956
MTDDATPDLAAEVIAMVAEQVGLPPAAIGLDDSFIDIGLESIEAVLLCGQIEERFALELDPVMVFEHPNIGSFIAAVGQIAAQAAQRATAPR